MPQTKEIRCPNCKKKIADAVGPTDIKCVCPRCKTDFQYSNLIKDKIILETRIEK